MFNKWWFKLAVTILCGIGIFVFAYLNTAKADVPLTTPNSMTPSDPRMGVPSSKDVVNGLVNTVLEKGTWAKSLPIVWLEKITPITKDKERRLYCVVQYEMLLGTGIRITKLSFNEEIWTVTRIVQDDHWTRHNLRVFIEQHIIWDGSEHGQIQGNISGKIFGTITEDELGLVLAMGRLPEPPQVALDRMYQQFVDEMFRYGKEMKVKQRAEYVD